MIIDYLNGVLGEGTPHSTSRGQQYSYCCPLCNDHKERLFVNIDNKKYICHNCQSAGSIITFMSEYHHMDWYDALKLFRQYEGYEIVLPDHLSDEIYERLNRNLIPVLKEKYVYPLPDEFTLIENATGKAGEIAIKYLRSRGISLSKAEQNYIGYCATGDYANRIIMPDFEQGELRYWQARTWLPAPTNIVHKKFYRKVLNPSLTEEQIANGVVAVDKSEIVGNIDFIVEEGMAVLCEGKMDSYTIGNTGACLHGKYMSDAQFIKLVQNKDKIGIIAIMMDGDAMKNAIVTAGRLYKHYDEVLICKLPKDKDPNNLGAKGCLEALNDAMSYSPMFDIKARLKGWI